jgi:hypothetical protein
MPGTSRSLQNGYPPVMQLPLASSLAVVALLSPTSAAVAPTAVEHEVADPSTDVADVPADLPVDALPPTSPCPAYEGPQCDSQEHEQYVTGQDIAELAGLPQLAA